MTASATSAPVRTTGGGAGSSTRPAASEAMASTTARSTSSDDGLGVGPGHGDDGPGHRPGQLLDRLVVDVGRDPADVEVERAAVGPAAGCAGRARWRPRATIRTAYTATRPSQVTLEPDAVAAEPAAHGDEPAEGVGHGDRQRGGPLAGRQRHAAVLVPPDGGAADALEAVGQARRASAGHRVGTGGPHHDLVGRPRRLQAHLARRVGRHEHGVGGVGRPRSAGRRPARGARARPRGRRRTWSRSGPDSSRRGVEVVLGVVEHALEGAPPGGRVGLQQGELLVCGDAVDRRPGGRLHRSCGLIHRSIRRSSAPHPRRQGDPGECGPAQASRNTPGEGVPPRWAGLQTSSA